MATPGARLSIRSMMLAVALFAAGLGAIAARSRPASDAAFSAYWTALMAALAGAIVARGRTRTACIGWLVFGLGYWLLAFEPDPSPRVRPTAWTFGWAGAFAPVPPTPAAEPGTRFITADAIDRLEGMMGVPLAPGTAVMARWTNGTYYPGTIRSFDGSSYVVAWDDGSMPLPVPPGGIVGRQSHVRTASHAVFGLLFSALGAWTSVRLSARSAPRGIDPSATVEGNG